MILRQFNDFDDDDEDFVSLKEYGILENRRTIFVFVDRNAYNARLVRNAKLVILNECAYMGDKMGNLVRPFIPHSVLVKAAVYFGNAIFEVPNELKSSYITIQSGFTKEKQSLFGTPDNRTLVYQPGYYSSSLFETAESIRESIVDSLETATLPPNYYTERHMFRLTGDYNHIHSSEFFSQLSGSQLLDNSTRVTYMDVNLWDTMRTDILGKLSSSDSRYNETFSLSQSVINGLSTFVGEGSIFIYDSDARGFGLSGSNIKGGKIPLGKYYHGKYIIDNLDSARTLFEAGCHDLEAQYGHVRVMAAPGSIGNKIKIIFKDYSADNQPIIPLGGFDQDGGKSAIDNGFMTDRIIEDTIECVCGEEAQYACYPYPSE